MPCGHIYILLLFEGYVKFAVTWWTNKFVSYVDGWHFV